jgi:hypothetical protein
VVRVGELFGIVVADGVDATDAAAIAKAAHRSILSFGSICSSQF